MTAIPTPSAAPAPVAAPVAPTPLAAPGVMQALDTQPAAPVSPVVGIDAPVAPVAAPAPVAPVAPEAPDLTTAEVAALQQKANNFDMISGDPQLSQHVLDHFRAKTGRTRQQPATPAPVVPQQQQQQQQYQTDPATQGLIDKQARQEVELFRLKNPDMPQYEQGMAALLGKYPNMDLQDAYRFSKQATPPASQNPAVVTPPAVPTTETNENAGIPEPNMTTDFSDIEKQINDPKATPHMDDAILAAFNAARAQGQ
tara:strand:- start:1497 stop:2261 length:765 start_codon:yes stop_codon:yes gene_type:complete